MVVRVPDFKGELYTKGRVIVPCHTTFNRRKDILTEVAYSEDKSKVQVNQIVSKISNSNASNIPDSLMMDNECELWNRRLNRWWGWNWQRKRKECMTKFGHQFGDFPDSREDNLYNNQCPCRILYNKSNKEMNANMMKSVRETETQNLPKVFENTAGFRMYRGRLKRNKRNKEYEGLLPEVSENTDAKIKQKKRCLHIHLLNVHSKILLNKNKTIIETHTTSKNIIHRSDPDVTNSKIEIRDTHVSMETNAPELTSVSAVNIVHSKSAPCSNTPSPRNSLAKSSKSYSLTEQAIAIDLTPISPMKDTDPSERETDWQNNYNKLKEEHNELLSAVCEILCENSSSVSNIFNKTNCECCPGNKMTQNTENIVDKENK